MRYLAFLILLTWMPARAEVTLQTARWPVSTDLTFDVGKKEVEGQTASQVVTKLNTVTGEWLSNLTDSGMSVAFNDGGNVDYPNNPDNHNTVTWVWATGNWAGKVFPYARGDAPWRLVEEDVRYKISTNWCFRECPGTCSNPNACYKLDYGTFHRHESGHIFGFDHCTGCTGGVNSVMATPGPVYCEIWNLGSMDQTAANEMYHGLLGDYGEPQNDFLDSGVYLGSINITHEDQRSVYHNGCKIVGDLDNDCFYVTVINQGDMNGWVLDFSLQPYSLDDDLAMEVYQNQISQGVVDNHGAGWDELFEIALSPGTWQTRVWKHDNRPGNDKYLMFIQAYRPTADAEDTHLVNAKNPAMYSWNNQLIIPGGEPGTISVFDASGRGLPNYNGISVTPPVRISLQSLPAGIYFSRLTTKNQVSTGKLVVVR